MFCYSSPVPSSECLASSISPLLYIFIPPMPSPHPMPWFCGAASPFERSGLGKGRVKHNKCSNSCRMFGLGGAQMWFLKRQRCWIPTTGTSQVLDWEPPSPAKASGGVKDHCRAELLCCNPWPRSEELPGTWQRCSGQVGSSSQLSDGQSHFSICWGLSPDCHSLYGLFMWNRVRVVPGGVGSEAEAEQG